MKHLKTCLILLALGAGAATFCEACYRLGSAATRAEIERTQTR